MTTLTTAGKQALKTRAHILKPLVIIGEKGLTETVLAEIDRALFDHELIKIKIVTPEKDLASEFVATIEADLKAVKVQSIGRIVVLYRKSSKKAK